MRKNIFHNNKSVEINLEVKEPFYLQSVEIKEKAKIIENVDVNKLLNRVKVDQQSEKKQKFIFFSLGFLLLGFVGIFVTIVN